MIHVSTGVLLDVTQKDVELLEEIQDFARMLLPTKTNKYLKMFI